MDLTIVRHNISSDNGRGLISGAGSDVDLSEAGIELAQEAQRAFDWNQFDQVFSSPMRRAKQTAELLLGDQASAINFDKRLTEMNFGDWDGTAEDAIFEQYPEIFNQMGMFNEKYSDYAPNSESYDELVNRVTSFLDELKQKYPTASILLICHGMTTRALFAALLHVSPAQFGKIGNVTLNQIHLDETNHFEPRIDLYNQKLN
ncbi:histidine phosphatase family protein [Pediococcus pentosaceus]|uniref:histidine phosphatase family protein n=1 Tax=Pediococcus pentosaceus TaxID=1255 RepID=UPI00398B37A8